MKTTSTIVIALLTLPLYSQLAVNPNSVGIEASATGDGATAMGSSTASGFRATAMGSSTASAFAATAMGQSTASGPGATAMGSSTASGFLATAMGQSTASGEYSLSSGASTTASGHYSVALGRNVSTNNHAGSFFFGDNDLVTKTLSTSNQFVCRFKGGYWFISGFTNPDNSTGDIGVRVVANDNAWSSISDRRRKENFTPLDDVAILEKLASIPYYSWNYKGLDPTTHRHYGIMAQDFYALFGQDQFGTIGSDTLVNPIDMMGIAMSAIKGLKMLLEEEKSASSEVIAELNQKVAQQNELIAQQNEMILALKEQEQTIQALRQQVEAISAALAKSAYSSSSQAGNTDAY